MKRWVPATIRRRTFNPNDVDGLHLWLDGRDTQGNGVIFTGTDTPAEWKDKSGAGHNFSVVDNLHRATRNANGFHFPNDGRIRYSSGYTAMPNAETLFIVLTMDNVNSWSFALSGSSSGSRNIGVYNIAPSRFGIVNSGVLWGDIVPQNATTSRTLITSVVSPPSGGQQLTQVAMAGNALGSGVSVSQFSAGLTQLSLGSAPMWGTIHEVIAYDRVLTNTERTSLIQYLNTKWSL